jgi:steroid delta-isomerase-like uncharacterized protein
MPERNIRKLLTMEPEQQQYRRIRELWIRHSKAEDQRDLDGLIATLSEDCVYQMEATGQRWEGNDGARQFYTEFLGAFPDVHFDLTGIVIGPQGVIEVADMTGTHEGDWAGFAASGNPVAISIVIYFPWDEDAKKFSGEDIYFDRLRLEQQLRASDT